jgi:hypothetical protein
MTAATNKLAVKLDSAQLAAALIAADLSYPTAIRSASDQSIEAAVGSENLSAVRAVFAAEQ